MSRKKQNNSGFSLIELIISLAVLAFLMLAVSSFMGSSVSQTKKEHADVRIQTQAQETYSLITDSIMQASDIVMAGYVASDPDLLKFNKVGEATTATMTKRYYVRDKETADALVSNPAAYGISGTVAKADVKYFTDLYSESSGYEKVFVTYMQIRSSVPLDLNYVPGANPNIMSTQSLLNTLTGELTDVDCTEQNSKKIYSVNDTLVSTFQFKDNNLYYGRKYAYMTDLDDVLDMDDTESQRKHLYNKYFSYNTATTSTSETGIPGCVATVNAKDGSIGIDLYYNQSDMAYTTLGRINTRNSYVLVPKN